MKRCLSSAFIGVIISGMRGRVVVAAAYDSASCNVAAQTFLNSLAAVYEAKHWDPLMLIPLIYLAAPSLTFS